MLFLRFTVAAVAAAASAASRHAAGEVAHGGFGLLLRYGLYFAVVVYRYRHFYFLLLPCDLRGGLIKPVKQAVHCWCIGIPLYTLRDIGPYICWVAGFTAKKLADPLHHLTDSVPVYF